ncbi:MAG: nucleotidyltransferase domain-containing protein [Candidatus Firestonebacteria bacterium]
MIQKLKEYFAANDDVTLVFLFGSYSVNRAMQDSDVDIAIWFKNPDDLKIINKIWLDVELLLNKSVDILRLNYASPTVAWTSLRGIPLAIKDYKLYLKLILNVSAEAEDSQNFIFGLWKLRNQIKREQNVTIK